MRWQKSWAEISKRKQKPNQFLTKRALKYLCFVFNEKEILRYNSFEKILHNWSKTSQVLLVLVWEWDSCSVFKILWRGFFTCFTMWIFWSLQLLDEKVMRCPILIMQLHNPCLMITCFSMSHSLLVLLWLWMLSGRYYFMQLFSWTLSLLLFSCTLRMRKLKSLVIFSYIWITEVCLLLHIAIIVLGLALLCTKRFQCVIKRY